MYLEALFSSFETFLKKPDFLLAITKPQYAFMGSDFGFGRGP